MATTSALLEYFVDDDRVVLLILTANSATPSVFVLHSPDDHVPLGHQMLADRSLRLSIDVNGLPPGWDADQRSRERYIRALRIAPAQNAGKRSGALSLRKLSSTRINYSFSYLAELGPLLLPPAAQELVADCDILCFVPHGPLHAVPFGLLEAAEGTPLMDVFGICQVPSAGLLPLLERRRRGSRGNDSTHPRTGLVVGCDAADEEGAHSLEDAATALAELIREGGFAVSELVGAQEGNAATRTSISEHIGGKTVVHLACHGSFAEHGHADPMLNCGVLIAEQGRRPRLGRDDEHPTALLSGRDVLNMSTTADLVTLQSCSGGRATTAPGDEQFGLVRAFLYAGASSLVVSLWDVNRDSSQLLLRRFYQHWIGGLPKWQALRAAQNDVRADVRYGHPFHWAGFVLVGDGR